MPGSPGLRHDRAGEGEARDDEGGADRGQGVHGIRSQIGATVGHGGADGSAHLGGVGRDRGAHLASSVASDDDPQFSNRQPRRARGVSCSMPSRISAMYASSAPGSPPQGPQARAHDIVEVRREHRVEESALAAEGVVDARPGEPVACSSSAIRSRRSRGARTRHARRRRRRSARSSASVPCLSLIKVAEPPSHLLRRRISPRGAHSRSSSILDQSLQNNHRRHSMRAVIHTSSASPPTSSASKRSRPRPPAPARCACACCCRPSTTTTCGPSAAPTASSPSCPPAPAPSRRRHRRAR